MSTWQMYSDAGNTYRWEVSGRVEPNGQSNQQQLQRDSSTPRLPSMADLLRQGCWKLLVKGEGVGNGNRTGLGKTVSLRQSSIAKAMSVPGAGDFLGDDVVSGGVSATAESLGLSNSLFQTGSGKSVNISAAGLVRAKALLGMEEDSGPTSSRGFQQPRKSYASNEQCGLPSSLMEGGGKSVEIVDGGLSVRSSSSGSNRSSVGTKLVDEINPALLKPELRNAAGGPPPIKFQTAGGRSLSVSSDALQRARSLLGDPDLEDFLNDGDIVDPAISVFREGRNNAALSNEEDSYSAFTHPAASKSKFVQKMFISPLKSSSDTVCSSLDTIITGSNLIKKFDAVENGSDCTSLQQQLCKGPTAPDTGLDNGVVNGIELRVNLPAMSSRGPLADISNTITTDRQHNSEKRRLGRGVSISLFKKPRSSKFKTPLNKEVSFVPSGLSSSSENPIQRRTVSTRYPFRVPRTYIKEYFAGPSLEKSMLEHITDDIRCIKLENAGGYMFCDDNGICSLGAEAFYNMLAQSGASSRYASKGWVINHYKWIVWKLACYERCYPAKPSAKLLTVSNVLEELKYRYEREVNHGHRSAIKRILEGDAPSSSMLVLCISAVDISGELKVESHQALLNGSECSNAAKVELTDGWYSIDALLDAPLSKHLAGGKLFVGQKLRIWGAGLHGWVGPVSPLELSRTVSLQLHINGTYRAHWADRLGFCKDAGPPLAFRCIKSGGGPVPLTLLGVTRIYPVLYKEKLSTSGTIVRTERMEAKMVQVHNQRRSALMEGIVSEFQRASKDSNSYNDSDSEGAIIFRVLEKAAEPEILMAEMSSEQLSSFASYQAKLEAIKQLDMEKAVDKALRDAALGEREVTPFMRVRVVGLTSYQGNGITKEGLITIWNPTEKQQNELVEGQAYNVEGLLPVSLNVNTLYLQARGLTTKWQPLPSLTTKNFQPFFNPRMSALLANLGEVPLGSEFDLAAFVLHVGEVHMVTQQKKQWIFVTDSSVAMSQSGDTSNSLLAISFCSPAVDDDSSAPINCNLAGSVVGFCNLIKRAKDSINNLWIAEATENSDYYLSFDSPKCSHLKHAASSAQHWAKISSLIIHKLKQKILLINGDHDS